LTPVKLYAAIVRYSGSNPADCRCLIVTMVYPERNDWRVSLFWPGGVGEVDFSLKTGRVWGPRSAHVPWKLEAGSARDIIEACKQELRVPDCCQGVLWWAFEFPVDQSAVNHGEG
jgi:hypothetical protein